MLQILRGMRIAPPSALTSGYPQDVMHTKYSIIISTYDRYEFLLYLLDYYGKASAQMPNLDAIFIAWGLGANGPPVPLNLSAYDVPIYLERAERNSLSERFRIPSRMRTEAAFWTDDDIHVLPSSVEIMFRAWKNHGRPSHRIMGLTGRKLERTQGGIPIYQWDESSTYDLVLTNAAFMDRTMMSWYWEDSRANLQARALVDKLMNCEDLLMNYIIASKTGLPPIIVGLPDVISTVLGRSAISRNSNHQKDRSLCLQKFEHLYGSILQASDDSIVYRNSRHRKSSGDWRTLKELPKDWVAPPDRSWGEDARFLTRVDIEKRRGIDRIG